MKERSHYADAKKSDRLKKVIALLNDGLWHTSLEIQRVSRSVAPHTDIHEIRKNGYSISPAKYMGIVRGHKRYAYRMKKIH